MKGLVAKPTPRCFLLRSAAGRGGRESIKAIIRSAVGANRKMRALRSICHLTVSLHPYFSSGQKSGHIPFRSSFRLRAMNSD
ncbi:hypothetical protein CDAR_26831 [Caerostris darwini]|uniref:Uncharacterized protein n=1 Tax=Caerostris darwini TaxID=1538125 RepID=A0AAV4TKI0_9ARAC|nr:hypothetical protein CDAR_26831 [Caerostris darwini]